MGSQTITANLERSTRPSSGAGSADELAPGTTFGRYLVTKRLGAGGAGTVHAAYDPELDRRIALKLLHRRWADEGTDQHPDWRRLVVEARALARLSHPNVVVVYEVGLEAGQAYLATELVDGTDLAGWLALEPRPPWPVILDVFVAAGRGLAAAHDARVIHGDFKPGNVLIGSDGRPRVADFGVARVYPAVDREDTVRSLDAGDDLDTTARGLVGTPYYMAPEQLDGSGADERSDQYSFCLALLEALLGRRLYEAPSVPALVAAKLVPLDERGDLQQAPRAVRAALRRGLAVSPDARYRSMHALLDALTAWRSHRRRRRLAGALGGAIVGGVALGWGMFAADASPGCEGASRHVDALWSPDRRERIATAFAGARPAIGPRTWTKVEEEVTAWTDDWTSARREACMAARYQETDDATVAARRRCLDDRLAQLGALLEVLETADETTVIRSIDAVHGLAPITTCTDDAVVRWFPEPTGDTEARAALDDRLRRIDALRRVARFEPAAELAREGLETADTEEVPGGRAELQVRLGSILLVDGDLPGAERELAPAILDAVANGRDLAALEGIASIVRVTGGLQTRVDEARDWGRWAEPLARRAGAPASLRAKVLAELAAVDFTRKDFAAAVSGLERAIALLDPDGLQAAHIELELAEVLRDRGDMPGARHALEHATPIIERELGADHPDFAAALNLLGTVLWSMGEPEAGRAACERALGIYEAVFGPEHPSVGLVLNNLANMAAMAGDYDEARGFLERTLGIQRARFGPDHPLVTVSLANLGAADLEAGHPERALPELEQAADIERRAGREGPDLVFVMTNLAMAYGNLGRPRDAVAAAEEGVELADRALEPENPARADMHERLGWARELVGDRAGALAERDAAIALLDRPATAESLELGRALAARGHLYMEMRKPTQAIEDIERAEAILRPHGDRRSWADCAFDLGRLLAPEQPARAHALAAEAAAVLDELGDERAAAVHAWLDGHPGPGN